jgi:hypothetical protein
VTEESQKSEILRYAQNDKQDLVQLARIFGNRYNQEYNDVMLGFG